MDAKRCQRHVAALVHVYTHVTHAGKPGVARTYVASSGVEAGAAFRAGGVTEALVHVLAVGAVALETIPALAVEGSKSVEACGGVGTAGEVEGALIDVHTQGGGSQEAVVTDTRVAPLRVGTGTVVRTADVPRDTFVHVLTARPVLLKPLPAVAHVGAVGVDAARERRAGPVSGPLAFVHVAAAACAHFIAVLAEAVEGAAVWAALAEGFADAAQAGVFAHAQAPVVHEPPHAGTGVGTGAVAARHVPAAGRGQLTLIHILADETVPPVAVPAPARVGPLHVEAHGLGAAVVRQRGVALAFVKVLAVEAIALRARRTGTGERSRCVSAAGNQVASSILDLALIKVYNLSKMGQCQGPVSGGKGQAAFKT